MENLEFKIRSVTFSDLHTISEFIHKNSLNTYPFKIIKKTIRFNIQESLKLAKHPTYFLVACQCSQVIAFTVVRYRRSVNAYEIECICKENLRRHGVATNLVSYAISKLSDHRDCCFFASISPDNKNSVALFVKLGFKPKPSTDRTGHLQRLFLKLEHPKN